MVRVACIDVGTNTALLLIADLEPLTGQLMMVDHWQTIIRLGKNVDEQRLIARPALDRLIDCLSGYREICREHNVRTILAAGTSALRDAKNRKEIIDEVARKTGIVLRCISGEEEAELTFFGAVAGMGEIPEPFTVIDIGGGSTEIIMGTSTDIRHSVSLDIGSVRLTERFFTSLPASQAEFTAAKEEIDRQLTSSLTPFFSSREEVYGVAGTLTTIAQVCMGSRIFIPDKAHRHQLAYNDVQKLLERLRTMTLKEIVALGIPEGRADVFPMGTLILHQFMRLLGVGSITVSIQGMRFGMAQKELIRLGRAALK